MVNEMGNTNSSGDQENAAVDAQQKGETAGNANGVKEENNITPEGESKDYHEKAAALPTFDTSTDKELQLKNSEDDKTDEDKGETQIKQCSEVQTGANDIVSEVTNIETHTSQYGQKVDQLMESILEENDAVHDQACKKKGEAEGSLSNDEVLESDPVESSSVATDKVEEHFNSSPSEEQETPEDGRSGQNENKTLLISSEISLADKTVVADANDQNVTTQQDACLMGELDAIEDLANEEKHEIMRAENSCSIRVDLDETPKVESSQSDATGSLLADSPRVTPSSSFGAVIETQGKCMVHTPETELTSNESENTVKKCDPKEPEAFMQAVPEMQNDNSAPSVESHPIEATEEKLPGNNTNTDSVMDYSIEEDKARSDINIQPDILYHDHVPPVEQHVHFEETFEMVPEIGVLPTEFIGTTTKENGFLEKEKEGVEKSSEKEIREECILHLGPSKPENGVDIAYVDGRIQGFESVEAQKERNTDLREHDNCEFVVTEDSSVFELNISEIEIPKIADFAETENTQNVQPSLDTLTYSNGKSDFDQKVPNFHYETPSKAPESIGRLSLETIPEKSSNGIDLRKSPSFDFGIHRRSSESDQTPLLCPEKTPTRSLSLGSNAKFPNSTMRIEHNRNSLDYEAVAVEEKTIRVERSDSDISSAPLLGLSNKGENGDLKVTSETQQVHVAVMKGEELQASQEKETSLTSPKGRGKRKPRPSFFTTCICCTTATHY
ncbi:uncharacterized protein LOC129881836 [Solanum dulcamara]|uniref:uncharacterized protein LOC129881836 n=1 Tax=Solanum dulcamara TaxID=45834 RepID=UPI002486B9BA|nr:uncharacterized protein LOC129881836 [Solanum dulcamara]